MGEGTRVLGQHARSPQHAKTHTNWVDPRGTMEKSNSDQFWKPVRPTPCFFDYPRALWERTPCLLELNVQNAAFSNVLQTPTRMTPPPPAPTHGSLDYGTLALLGFWRGTNLGWRLNESPLRPFPMKLNRIRRIVQRIRFSHLEPLDSRPRAW